MAYADLARIGEIAPDKHLQSETEAIDALDREKRDASKPYVMELAASTEALIRDVIGKNKSGDTGERFYLSLLAKYKDHIEGFRIDKTDEDKSRWASLPLQERGRDMELWRDELIENEGLHLLIRVASSEHMSRQTPEAQAKVRVGVAMCLQALTSEEREVDTNQFQELGLQSELEHLTNEERTKLISAINDYAACGVPSFWDFAAEADLPESNGGLHALVALEKTFQEIVSSETPTGEWNFVNLEKAAGGLYADHYGRVQDALAAGKIERLLDIRVTDEMNNPSRFFGAVRAKPHDYIAAADAAFVDEQTGEQARVKVMKVTLMGVCRTIERRRDFKPSDLQKAWEDKTLLNWTDYQAADFRIDSPQAFISWQERFDAVMISEDGKSVRLPINPPPNYIVLNMERFTRLQRTFEDCKKSFETNAHVDFSKIKNRPENDVNIISERGIDTTEYKVFENKVRAEMDGVARKLRGEGNGHLANQVEEANLQICGMYKNFYETLGDADEYQRIAIERISYRKEFRPQDMVDTNKVYVEARQEELESIKIEYIYKAVALKNAYKQIMYRAGDAQAAGKSLLNVDYEVEQYLHECLGTRKIALQDPDFQRKTAEIIQSIRNSMAPFLRQQTDVGALQREVEDKAFVLGKNGTRDIKYLGLIVKDKLTQKMEDEVQREVAKSATKSSANLGRGAKAYLAVNEIRKKQKEQMDLFDQYTKSAGLRVETARLIPQPELTPQDQQDLNEAAQTLIKLRYTSKLRGEEIDRGAQSKLIAYLNRTSSALDGGLLLLKDLEQLINPQVSTDPELIDAFNRVVSAARQQARNRR